MINYQRVMMGLSVLFMIVVLATTTSCGVVRRINFPDTGPNSSVSSKNTGISQSQPRSFIVYPFRNTSFTESAGPVARRAFQAQFAMLGEVKSMKEVDHLASRTWSVQDALRVGKEMGVDAVVVGEAQNCESSWLLLLSYNYVSASIQVFDVQRRVCIYTGKSYDLDATGSPLLFPQIISNITRNRAYFMRFNNIASDIVNDINPLVFKAKQ